MKQSGRFSGFGYLVAISSGIGLLLLLVISGSACLFSPRETGHGGGGGIYIPQTEPEIGLTNIKAGLEIYEMSTYGRAFAEDQIKMEFAEIGVGDPSLFDNWNNTQEEALMTSILVGNSSTVEIHWQDPIPPLAVQEVDEKYYEDLEYRVVVTNSGAERVFEGKVDLWFKEQSDGLWLINKWIDKEADTSINHTWGWLRLKNTIEW